MENGKRETVKGKRERRNEKRETRHGKRQIKIRNEKWEEMRNVKRDISDERCK